MLVLSRRENESLTIGDDVVITVVRAEDGRVRIGISAPREVAVVRAELLAADDRPESALPASCRLTPAKADSPGANLPRY